MEEQLRAALPGSKGDVHDFVQELKSWDTGFLSPEEMKKATTALRSARRGLGAQCRQCEAPAAKSGRLVECTICLAAHYCDRDCHRLAWLQHKPVCDFDRLTANMLT